MNKIASAKVVLLMPLKSGTLQGKNFFSKVAIRNMSMLSEE